MKENLSTEQLVELLPQVDERFSYDAEAKALNFEVEGESPRRFPLADLASSAPLFDLFCDILSRHGRVALEFGVMGPVICAIATNEGQGQAAGASLNEAMLRVWYAYRKALQSPRSSLITPKAPKIILPG